MSKERLPITRRRILKRLVSYGIKAPEAAQGLAPHVVIRAIRNGLRMTQAQLARRAGMPQSHVAKIETGKVDAQLSTLRKILRAMFCEMVLVPKFKKTPQAAIAGRVKEVARRRGLTRSEEKRLMSHPSSAIWEEPPPKLNPSGERAEMPLRIVAKNDDRADLRFWLGKSSAERVDAMEFLREQYYALSGHKTLPRLARAVQVTERRA